MTSSGDVPLDVLLVQLIAQAERVTNDSVCEAALRRMLAASTSADEPDELAFREALASIEANRWADGHMAADGVRRWRVRPAAPEIDRATQTTLDDAVIGYLIRLTLDDLFAAASAKTEAEVEAAVDRAASRLQSAAHAEPDAARAAVITTALLQERDNPFWVPIGLVAFVCSEPAVGARIGLQVAAAVEENDPDTAAEIWESTESLGIHGPSGYAGFRRGCWLARCERVEEAADTFRRALGLADEPTAALISYELGRVLLSTGDIAGAVAALELATMSDDPEHAAAARRLRGVAAAKAGDANMAVADLLPIVEAGLLPDAEPQTQAEQVLIVVLSTAPDHARRIIRESPEPLAAYVINRLVSALAFAGRLDEAQHFCEGALASGRPLLMDYVARAFAQFLRAYRDVPSILDALALLHADRVESGSG